MDVRELGKEVGTITVVLAIAAVIALLSSGGDTSFLRDLAGEWVTWVAVLVLIAVVFGATRLFRRKR